MQYIKGGIINAPKSDWTEWQAGWVSSAILMPASSLRAWATECAKKFGATLPFARTTNTFLLRSLVWTRPSY
jgi:hypothetical protein